MPSLDLKTGKTLRVEDAINVNCPWSGEPIDPDSLTLYEGHVVGFCNPGCRDIFAKAIALLQQELPGKKPSSLAKAVVFFEELRSNPPLAKPPAHSSSSDS